MRNSIVRINLFSGVAAAALFAGSGIAIAEQVAVSSNDSASARFLEVARTLQEKEARQQVEAPSLATETDGFFRKFTVPTNGVYRFAAPVGSGIKLYINGTLAIDASGPSLDDTVDTVTALQTLSAGDHALRIVASSDDAAAVAEIVVSPVGAEPRALVDVSSELSPSEGIALAAQNAAIVSPGGTSAEAPTEPRGRLGLAGLGDKPAFSIGGSSSRARGANTASAGNSGAATDDNNSTALPRMAALSPQMTTAPTTTTTQSSGGGSVSVPRTSGGGGGGGAGGGGTAAPNTPNAPGTPTATPTPTAPAPAPTPINPATQPTPETVQASPLSPPTNVEITQAVQLTSAGNVNGQVPNTGSTLFGAVMSNSVFDIVNVQVSGSNRSATVDVGPITGQFAVRLFPEDFAANNSVQVTLTGASSASDEVEATPVVYTLTGMTAEDGVSQALSRLTFGATPDLYARVRSIGFQNYVEEQLNPASINDAAFDAMNPNALLRPTEQNGGRLLDSLMRYEISNAAFSEKQLQNVMGQFWANHFHAINKDSNIVTQAIDDRQFFRENAFGNFAEMLLYSAQSPLMSQYLDNDQSRAGRINENYGREILELSTVGVEAGYGPDDVIAVSRVFTGWHYERTNPNASDVAATYRFDFKADRHDEDDKVVPFLGMTIAGRAGAAGVQEGEELIQILANHPSTRTRTCRKIVELLVSDTPPQSLIQACAAAWGDGGDVTAMLRAVLLDPSYVTTAEYQRNKAKTPFEYAVSVIRTFGARPDGADDDDFYDRFYRAAREAGQDFVRFPLPTGLPEVAAAWTNSASMVASYNQITDVAERRQDYNIDLAAEVQQAGIETAEEVAAYLLAIGTADRFRLEEFDAMVAVLKGEDGIFEPLVRDETQAFEKAMGLLVVLPSFQLQ